MEQQKLSSAIQRSGTEGRSTREAVENWFKWWGYGTGSIIADGLGLAGSWVFIILNELANADKIEVIGRLQGKVDRRLDHECRRMVPGVWFRLKAKYKNHVAAPIKTNGGFVVPRHPILVATAAGWIKSIAPHVTVTSEMELRKVHGWYCGLAPRNIKNPWYNYVPDFLLEYNVAGSVCYLRVEVQLSFMSLSKPGRIDETCVDHYPVLLLCLPGRKNYYRELVKDEPRFLVEELFDEEGVLAVLKKTGLTDERMPIGERWNFLDRTSRR